MIELLEFREVRRERLYYYIFIERGANAIGQRKRNKIAVDRKFGLII
jgi:hypothetical protein